MSAATRPPAIRPEQLGEPGTAVQRGCTRPSGCRLPSANNAAATTAPASPATVPRTASTPGAIGAATSRTRHARPGPRNGRTGVERPIQSQFGAHPRAVLGRGVLPEHEQDRVAHETEQRESDQAHDQHDCRRLRQPPETESEHQRSERFTERSQGPKQRGAQRLHRSRLSLRGCCAASRRSFRGCRAAA